MRAFVLLAAACVLAGCTRPAWLPLPDTASWGKGQGVAVVVEEVARANVCNTVSDESELQVIPSVDALEGFARQRGFEWVRTSAKAWPETGYAIVEYGQRTNSGYGLAVSRDAELRGDVLILRATFFEPQQGRWASDEASSPCVAVALPAGAEFSSVSIFDQTGRARISIRTGGA